MRSKRPAPAPAATEAEAAAAPRYAVVLTKLIDPPEAPLRASVEGISLDQLAESVRAQGLIEPLIVCDAPGGRYRVIAGHRRLRAAQLAGLDAVPVIIRNDHSAHDALALAENVDREELAPADEAAFIGRLYESLGRDVDAVADHVRRPRAYVDRYLALLDANPAIIAALRENRIGVGQAEQLARCRSEAALVHLLGYVVSSGATVRQVRDWTQQANAREENEARLAAVAAAPGAGAEAPAAPPAAGPSYLSIARPYELPSGLETRQCRLCAATDEESNMWRWYVCAPCGNEFTARAVADGRTMTPTEKPRAPRDV